MPEVSQASAFEFLKRIVELTGVYYVDKDKYIRINNGSSDHDGELIYAEDGGKKRPIMLLHENMVRGEYAPLNPFSEVLGRSGSYEWLNTYLSLAPGFIIREILLKIVEICTSKEDTSKEYSDIANHIASEYTKLINAKTADELQNISVKSYARIVFMLKTRTAVLSILSTSGNAKAFRANTLKFIKSAIGTLLGVELAENDSEAELKREDDTVNQMFSKKSVNPMCGKFDATMRTLIAVLATLRPYVQDYLKRDIDTDYFMLELDNLEAYHKMFIWFARALDSNQVKPSTSSVKPWADTPTTDANGIPIPAQLRNQIPLQTIQQVNQQPVDANGIPIPAQLLNNPQPPMYGNYNQQVPLGMMRPGSGVFQQVPNVFQQQQQPVVNPFQSNGGINW